MVDAIRLRAKSDLARLRSSTARNELRDNLRNAEAAERELLSAFRGFLSEGPGSAQIRLTREEKTHNLAPFIPAISFLYALRNRSLPSEMRKLELLLADSDFPEYSLMIDFDRKNAGKGKFFIRRISIVGPAISESETEPSASERSEPKPSASPSVRNPA